MLKMKNANLEVRGEVQVGDIHVRSQPREGIKRRETDR